MIDFPFKDKAYLQLPRAHRETEVLDYLINPSTLPGHQFLSSSKQIHLQKRLVHTIQSIQSPSHCYSALKRLTEETLPIKDVPRFPDSPFQPRLIFIKDQLLLPLDKRLASTYSQNRLGGTESGGRLEFDDGFSSGPGFGSNIGSHGLDQTRLTHIGSGDGASSHELGGGDSTEFNSGPPKRPMVTWLRRTEYLGKEMKIYGQNRGEGKERERK